MMKLAAELEARARVLIVEDDSAARTTLQAIVSEFYEVEVVEDAEQAERALMRSDIQVLITDYEMPGRSGVDLITMVFERYPMIVPILLTGHTTKREVRQADKDRNVFAVLAKPFAVIRDDDDG